MTYAIDDCLTWRCSTRWPDRHGSCSAWSQGIKQVQFALVFRATWSHRQFGINASSHLERHDAKFHRLLGSSLTFTHLMPVGTSFLDFLVPVLAGWGSSNRRIAA